jgi:hypothetical protein
LISNKVESYLIGVIPFIVLIMAIIFAENKHLLKKTFVYFGIILVLFQFYSIQILNSNLFIDTEYINHNLFLWQKIVINSLKKK